MAKIILEPREVFEHFHQIDSVSILLKGKVKYTSNDTEIEMQIGQRITTPANISHSLSNIGNEVAEIRCLHELII